MQLSVTRRRRRGRVLRPSSHDMRLQRHIYPETACNLPRLDAKYRRGVPGSSELLEPRSAIPGSKMEPRERPLSGDSTEASTVASWPVSDLWWPFADSSVAGYHSTVAVRPVAVLRERPLSGRLMRMSRHSRGLIAPYLAGDRYSQFCVSDNAKTFSSNGSRETT